MLTAKDGKCAWCKKINSCVSTTTPVNSDLNYNKKQYEYNYFINNQSKYNCGYNSVNCNNPNCLNTPSPSASSSKYTLLQTPVYIKTK
jgi:hypothetical protein